MTHTLTPADREAADWRRMPFLNREGGWNPCRAKGPERCGEEPARKDAADWAIGAHYAATLVDHIRAYPDAGGRRMVQLASAIAASGTFGPVERGLFYALGACLERGAVPSISSAVAVGFPTWG